MSVLLEVDDLKISARRDDDSLLPIVKGVSFNVARGEVVALIGESGSGKTTIALSALGYTKPGLEFVGGEVRLESEDVITMESNQLRVPAWPAGRLPGTERSGNVQPGADDR